MNTAQPLIIREARIEDAASLVAYMHRLTNEPHNNILLDPGQWNMTEEQEREFLSKRVGNPTSGIFCVADLAGQIAGVANLNRGATSSRSHTAALGMSVDAAFRRRGIASALMQYLLDWALAQGLIRIELRVFERNVAAIHLYKKFRFEIEGRHSCALLKQGVWIDDLTMGLILK
jgi:RimJ/RimL family protein N-acetyltransferase